MEPPADASRLCMDPPATLACMHSVHLGKLPISVIKLSGERMEFEVSWEESVAEFKLKLGQFAGVTPCCQVLLFGACELESHCQLQSYAHEVPLTLTLLVRQEPPEEVRNNTQKLMKALRVGMAPCPCPLKAIVRCRSQMPLKKRNPSGTSSVAQPSQSCIHAQARKLVPGRTPAARKFRELRRKALARQQQPKAIKKIWRQTRHSYYLENCYEQASWAGLEIDVERTIRHCEVDLEGFQVVKLALRAGCGELALLCLRHGADPTAVSLREAVKYFHGRRRMSSDPLVPPPDVVFRNPADGFTLVRAICDLWRRQEAMCRHSVDALAAARSKLARVTTELALLRPFGGEPITKEEVSRAAGMSHTECDASGDSLWTGWPMSFLTFSEPKLGTCRRLDPDFMRARACLVASSVCQPRLRQTCGETVHCGWSEYYDSEYDWRDLLPGTLDELNEGYDMWKRRNEKWRRLYTTKRRVRRVPWATRNGASASHSSRMARRFPKAPSHWATSRRHRRNQSVGWDGQLLDTTGEFCMPTPEPDEGEIGGFLPTAPSARLLGMWTLNLKQYS